MLDPHLIAHTRPIAKKENLVLSGNYRVTVLSDRLFRVEKSEEQTFCDKATQTIWFRDMPAVPFTTSVKNGVVSIKTASVTLVLKENFSESYILFGNKRVKLSNSGNLLGTYRTLDCCDGDISHPEAKESRKKLKLYDGVVSRSGVALYDDSASLILAEDGRVYPRDNAESDIYIFAFGHDYRAAVRALYMICGNVPQIPRFAFGNWWSRYHAYSESEYLHVLDRLAKNDIPLTVATIDMDWHWSETLEAKKHIRALGKYGDFYGAYSGWTGYSWNTDLFPDYKRFLQKIKDRNLHITLNLHPKNGVRWFEDQYAEMAKAVGIDPATEQFVEFDMTNDDFVNAYFRILHKPYEHDGVDFWWIDWQQGVKSKIEGLDPLWQLNHYHTLDIAKESKTPLILSRYNGVGAHRYPLGFSGDTYVTWESLNYIPYFTATASNIGYTFWSHDIGGHMLGLKDNELYTRYVQFGAFSPINRLHCTSTPVCTKEPAIYMNGTGAVAERFLRLRHRMIPYLYSAAKETSEHGIALIEPLYYECPEEPEAYARKNEYFFGGQLIVAPVTTKGDKDKLAVTKVFLPTGKWTDIFTGDTYTGGKTVEMVRWLDSMPVLLKEGGFLPLDGREHTNRADEPEQLVVLSSNGNGAYTLREDSGNTQFTSELKNGVQKVTICADNGVPTRSITLEMRNIPSGTVRVLKNGTDLPFEMDDDEFLSVTLSAVEPDEIYEVFVSFTEDKIATRNSSFFYSLQRFENPVQINNSAYGELRGKTDEECRHYIQEHKSLSKNQKKRLLEALALEALA